MKQLTPWDVAYAVNMAVACGISYAIITQVVVPFVDRSDVLLGGMWAVVATTFVFRESRESTLSAGLNPVSQSRVAQTETSVIGIHTAPTLPP